MRNLFAKILILLATVMPGLAIAQSIQITGTVIDSSSTTDVVGAYVSITKNLPESKPEYVTTDSYGKFIITGLNQQTSYTLKITYLGYQDFVKSIKTGTSNLNIGSILIREEAANLKEVKVVGAVTPMEQKGDTTQFNAAAFKTNPDATTEDLIQKMPGITVTNGTVTAHGETVNKVLVDGKPFFGDDATLTLKSIPAEIVDKIEVFDKLSDQAHPSQHPVQ